MSQCRVPSAQAPWPASPRPSREPELETNWQICFKGVGLGWEALECHVLPHKGKTRGTESFGDLPTVTEPADD